MIEGTATNVPIQAFEQRVLNVRIVDNTAVLITRVDRLAPATGRNNGRMVWTHVYTRPDKDSEWKLLHRTATEVRADERTFARYARKALGLAEE